MIIKTANILLSNSCVQGITQRAFYAFSHLIITEILCTPTSMIHSSLWIKKWRPREMKYLPKVTQPTHSPELASLQPHSTTSTRLPLRAKGCIKFLEPAPRWERCLWLCFVLAMSKGGMKELWKQPTQKVENRAEPQDQSSSDPDHRHHDSQSTFFSLFFTSISFLSPWEDHAFIFLTNISGAQHNPALWEHLRSRHGPCLHGIHCVSEKQSSNAWNI